MIWKAKHSVLYIASSTQGRLILQPHGLTHEWLMDNHIAVNRVYDYLILEPNTDLFKNYPRA